MAGGGGNMEYADNNTLLQREINNIRKDTKEVTKITEELLRQIQTMRVEPVEKYINELTSSSNYVKGLQIANKSLTALTVLIAPLYPMLAVGTGIGAWLTDIVATKWGTDITQNKETYDNALKDASSDYKKQYPDGSKLRLENDLASLKKELDERNALTRRVILERFARSQLANRGAHLPPESGALAKLSGESNNDLINKLLVVAAKYTAGTERLKEMPDNIVPAVQQTPTPQPLRTKVAEDTKTPSVAILPKVKPVAKPVETSGYEKLAAATKEATQAEESLQTSQAASSLALENNLANVEAVSDAYSGYSNALMGAADSMSYLALTEETVAQKQSITAEILNNALNEAQARVDNLAGNSLVELSNAFAGAVVNGESFGEALKSIGENILYTIIQMQALSWITSLFGFGGGGMEKFGAFTPSNSILNLSPSSPYGAWGSAISALLPFAKGGIVSQPTLFGFAKGIGLMGEAGAEAIMPLGRDSRGNLGVRVADSAMSGAGTDGVFAPHVEINVENKGGGDMSEEQARTLGTQVKAIVEMQVAKQMYEYMRNGTLRPSMGRGY